METSVNGKVDETQKVVLEEEASGVVETDTKIKQDGNFLETSVIDEISEHVKETDQGNDSISCSSVSKEVDVSVEATVDEHISESEHLEAAQESVDSISVTKISNVELEIVGKSSHVMESKALKEEEGVVLDADVNASSSPPSGDYSYESYVFEELSESQEVVTVEDSGVSDVTELVEEAVDENTILSLDETDGVSMTEMVSEEEVSLIGGKALPNLNGNSQGVVSVIAGLESKEVKEKKDVSSFDGEKIELSSVATDSVSKEAKSVSHEKNAAEGSSYFVDKSFNDSLQPEDVQIDVLSGLVDLPSKENVDGLVESGDVKTSSVGEHSKSSEKSSDIVGLASKGNGDNLLEPVDNSSVQSSNAAEHSNESQIPASAEYQPIINIPPHTPEPTSWRSCCGLFDVLRRSNR